MVLWDPLKTDGRNRAGASPSSHGLELMYPVVGVSSTRADSIALQLRQNNKTSGFLLRGSASAH